MRVAAGTARAAMRNRVGPMPTPASATRTPTRSTPAAATRSISAALSTITSAPSRAARSSSVAGLTGPLTTIARPSTPTTSRASAYSAAQTTSWPAPSAAIVRRIAGRRFVL